MSPRALALFAALVCSGCSFALMRPVPDDHAQQVWVECTSSRLAPVADGVGAGYGVLGALAIQVFETSGHGDGEVSSSGRAVQVAALGVAAVYVASMIHGLGSARECESARNASYARQLEAADSRTDVPAHCASDADCKAARVCSGGSCAWPAPPAPAPAPATAPAPGVAPAAAPAPAPPATPVASPPAPGP
jgi:hypothetical protein